MSREERGREETRIVGHELDDALSEASESGGVTLRVEPVPVHDRLGILDAEYARFRVAGLRRGEAGVSFGSARRRKRGGTATHLRLGRDAADLDVAESEVEEAVDSLGVFVEPSGDPDRVVEFLAPQLRRPKDQYLRSESQEKV